jgi:tetratricopeptide (TPR) repeat protein
LSHIHDLLVISRSSAMTFKGTKKTIPEIARSVNVRYVLEGSVRKAGQNLRITAQLIDAESDIHLWAERYSGILDEVFEIQEKVSRSIAEALRIKLTPEEKQGLGERPVHDVRAYECYLKAQQEIWRWTQDGFDRAVQYLNNGLDIVGENALLRAGLGYVYWNFVNLGFKGDDFLDKAEESARAALELDPVSQKSQFVLGLIHNLRGSQVECIRQLQKSVALDANDSDALFWLASSYSMLAGKTQACVPLVERLVRRDPLNPNSYLAQGLAYFFDGRFDLALEPFSRAFQMETESPPHQFYLAETLLINQRQKEAFEIIARSEKDFPDHPFTQLGGVLLRSALEGHKGRLESLKREYADVLERDPYFPTLMAEAFALLNEREEAIDWLEQAVRRGNFNYPFFQKHDPFYGNIRSEARFKALMERVMREWENFEV